MYQYGGLENEPPTPVKMYSPFSIESPMPKSDLSWQLDDLTPVQRKTVDKKRKNKIGPKNNDL